MTLPKKDRTTDHPLSITVKCPACSAAEGQPCTAPTDTSRRVVRWFHSARTTLALANVRGSEETG